MTLTAMQTAAAEVVGRWQVAPAASVAVVDRRLLDDGCCADVANCPDDDDDIVGDAVCNGVDHIDLRLVEL